MCFFVNLFNGLNILLFFCGSFDLNLSFPVTFKLSRTVQKILKRCLLLKVTTLHRCQQQPEKQQHQQTQGRTHFLKNFQKTFFCNIFPKKFQKKQHQRCK